MAPTMSLFGAINIPVNAYNNYRVYGTTLLALMFLCVLVGVKFVSKFSPVALFCVIGSIVCIYVGIFISHSARGPRCALLLFHDLASELLQARSCGTVRQIKPAPLAFGRTLI